MRENPLSLIEKFKEHQGKIYVSSITAAEMLFGAVKKCSEKLRAQIMRFISLVYIVDWDFDAADHYAAIRGELERTGQPIDNMDMMIAACAMSKGFVLVSNNVRHFEKIKGLDFETWL
jgi:tRNA(fMet)-specific endonuclease VapC